VGVVAVPFFLAGIVGLELVVVPALMVPAVRWSTMLILPCYRLSVLTLGGGVASIALGGVAAMVLVAAGTVFAVVVASAVGRASLGSVALLASLVLAPVAFCAVLFASGVDSAFVFGS